MRYSEVDLTMQFYTDNTREWSVQDLVNYILEAAETPGTRTKFKYRTAPGLKEYINVGTGPIRGIHNAEGALFIVQGVTLYQYLTTGTLTPLGLIPGSGRVSMSHNQFGTGNQLLVENGSPGGGYVYDTNTEVFSIITDPGYPGSISTTYLDQFLIGVEPLGRFWFHSNLSDATDYNTLDRYTSEASPDKIVAVTAVQGDVMVLNQTTIEFFRNTGAATGTFQRTGAVIDIGCASRWSVQNMDNSVFWLGNDGIIYRLNGYAAQPVSTRAIERAIAGCNLDNAISYLLEEEGHKIYYLHFPDGATWGYDVVTGLWHRRESQNTVTQEGYGRWRIGNIVKWSKQTLATDLYRGMVWKIDWNYFLEGQDVYVSRMRSPVLADMQNFFNVLAVEPIFATGQTASPDPIPAPIPVTPQNPPSPTITGTPPSGTVGSAYSFGYTVGSGTPPLSVSNSSGALPTGLSLNTSGVLSGVPTVAGTYGFLPQVTDAVGRHAEISSTVVIGPFLAPVYAAWPTATNAPTILTSPDAITWSTGTFVTADGTNSGAGYLIYYGGGRLFFFNTNASVQKVSTDNGANWVNISAGSGFPVSSMCYTGVAWIIAGNGSPNYGNWRSTNGVTFSAITVPTASTTQGAVVARGATVVMVRGSVGSSVSTDHGATWASYVMPASYAGYYMVDTGSYFITAALSATTTVYRSPTGLSGSWVAATLPVSVTPRAMAYGNGRTILVGTNAITYYSDDNGATWNTGGSTGPMTSSGTETPFKAVYAQGQFVVGGDVSRIYTSPDGIAWTTRFNAATRTIPCLAVKTYP